MQIKGAYINPPALRALVDEAFNGHVKIVDAYPHVPDWDYTTNVWIGMMLRPAHDASCGDCDDNRTYGHRGRRIHAVKWEVHAEFLRALFEKFPDARVRTSSPRGKFTVYATETQRWLAAKDRQSSRAFGLDDWLTYSASVYHQ